MVLLLGQTELVLVTGETKEKEIMQKQELVDLSQFIEIIRQEISTSTL